MRRFWLGVLCAALAVVATGCSVTITSTPVGTEMEDGRVYLGFELVPHRKGEHWTLVGAENGKFSSIRFQVTGRTLVLNRMVITFGNGERWSPQLRPEIPKGGWSAPIQLPGGQRAIEKISFFGHAKGKKGKMSKIEIYGTR